MNPRAAYFVEILKTIGSPLMGAVAENNGTETPDDITEDAKAVAGLLSQSVKTGIDLGELIDLGPMGESDDSMRVAMTGIAAQLLGLRYKASGGKPVGENQTKSLQEAAQAAMSFAENFTPAALNTQRLQDLAAQGQVVDLNQINVQYLQAFLPVLSAVQSFSFGQRGTKIIHDIAARISSDATAIGKTLTDNPDDELEIKRVSLGVLKALAEIYASCHREETLKALAKSDEERRGIKIDSVWESYETRLSLVQELSKAVSGFGDDSFVPETTSNEQDTSSSSAETNTSPANETPSTSSETSTTDKSAAPAIFSTKKPEETETSSAPNNSPPAQAPVTNPEASAANNPMAMFAKKPSVDPDDNIPLPEEIPETVSANVSDTPTENKPLPTSESNMTNNQDDTNASDESADDGDSGGANPMSFFKTPKE